MKDFIYIDMFSKELKDTLSKKQAFSMKALKDGFWGISPDYEDFLNNLIVEHDLKNNKLNITYYDNLITYNIIYNKNYTFKIKYLKTKNNLIVSDFNYIYNVLTSSKKDIKDETVKRYIYDSIYQSAFKQLNGISFESLYVADRSYINSLLHN